jgi:hypothetical protein
MSSVGTWQTIYRIKTNDPVVVNLASTELGSDTLPKESPDDARPLFSRFRVRVENSSGLFNMKDEILRV